jgi:large subunit ribosomal protein L3
VTTRVTTQNLKVVGTDPALGIVMVKGAVPGHEGSYVLIKDAVKRPLPKEAPFPAALKAKAEAAE